MESFSGELEYMQVGSCRCSAVGEGPKWRKIKGCHKFSITIQSKILLSIRGIGNLREKSFGLEVMLRYSLLWDEIWRKYQLLQVILYKMIHFRSQSWKVSCRYLMYTNSFELVMCKVVTLKNAGRITALVRIEIIVQTIFSRLVSVTRK